MTKYPAFSDEINKRIPLVSGGISSKQKNTC
jgi:hypothetical protein